MKIFVKVIPNSKKQEIKKIENLFGEESFEIKIKAKPENGKANLELIKLLSKKYGVSPENIKIIKGKNERKKILLIKTN